MQRQYNVIIEKDTDGYFVATVPELPGCHTQARSLDVLVKRIREAVELCLEMGDGGDSNIEFVGLQRIAVG